MVHCDIDVLARHRTGCRVLSQETSHDNAFSVGLWAIDDPMCLCQCRDSESFPQTLSCHRWSQPRCGLRLHRSRFDLVWIQHLCLRPRLLRLFCSASRLCLDAELQLVTSNKQRMTLTQIGTANPASEVYFFCVHGGLYAEFDKIFRKPVVRAFSALVTKKNQKVPIGVVLAG